VAGTAGVPASLTTQWVRLLVTSAACWSGYGPLSTTYSTRCGGGNVCGLAGLHDVIAHAWVVSLHVTSGSLTRFAGHLF